MPHHFERASRERDAGLRLGRTELCSFIVRRNPIVTSQRENETAAQGVAIDSSHDRDWDCEQSSHHARDSAHHCMAFVAAVARKGARIDARREDLTASGKNYPVQGNIISGSGKSSLKRSYCVEVERIDWGAIERNKKCFFDFRYNNSHFTQSPEDA